MSLFSFFKASSKFEKNLDNVNHITVNSSVYLSEDENSYKNFEIKDSKQRELIVSLIKREHIKITGYTNWRDFIDQKHNFIFSSKELGDYRFLKANNKEKRANSTGALKHLRVENYD